MISILNIAPSLLDWSSAVFTLTAMFNWIFIPISLGILFIIAIMESIYVSTGNIEWRNITQFWMKILAVDMIIGVVTGLILGFVFGVNWSNFSWFAGDIFGISLIIEVLIIFFLESAFLSIMFFGWKKVGKKTHLANTWLSAFGASFSLLWIFSINGWMQSPVGMVFNLDSARTEMTNFWEILFSPIAVNNFLHAISSGYILASLFVIGVSAYYLLHKRDQLMAKRSIIIAAIFGLLASIAIISTGNNSKIQIAEKQAMKFAAMKGLYQGQNGAEILVFGILNPKKKIDNNEDPFLVSIKFKKLISYFTDYGKQIYVPGINDLVYGNKEQDILSAQERIDKGKEAVSSLNNYKKAVNNGNKEEAAIELSIFRENFKHFGYSHLENPKDIVPNVPIIFYSFYIMISLGVLFILVFIIFLIVTITNKIEKLRWKKLLYLIGIFTVPLGFVASEAGWLVSKAGSQPWIVQDLMPISIGLTNTSASSMKISFFIFAFVFIALFIVAHIASIKIIKAGPKKGGYKL